jgi:hypothetical protein
VFVPFVLPCCYLACFLPSSDLAAIVSKKPTKLY